MEVPEKIKNGTVTWYRSFTPKYLSKENKNINSKTYIHSDVHCSIFYNSQSIWKQPKCPLDEWIKKMSFTHIMQGYSAKKK